MTDPAARSKSAQAYRWIKQGIAARRLTPGYRLVLATIADELDMSVVPVREAIRQLEAEGLVTYEFNVGARVSLVDVSQYRDAMQTLSIVEAAATALSAPLLTADDLDQARDLNAQMLTQIEHLDPHTFTELNAAFHSCLFRRCPNIRLIEIVNSEWLRLGGLRNSTFAFVPARARESVREHAHIISLIERSAPPAEVEMAARGHRDATLHAFMRLDSPDEVSDVVNI